MSQPVYNMSDDDIPIPDVSGLITEDDTPVESLFQEKQRRLLTHPLYASWSGPVDGCPFYLASNVAVFPTPSNECLVPDAFLSLDTAPKHPFGEKKNRSYFVWEHGKPPDVAIEIVSNTEGGELSRKVRLYERMRVANYVVFDPWLILGKEMLTRFVMLSDALVQQEGMLWLPRAGIGLTLWCGEFEGAEATWLRWCFQDKSVVPTGTERAEQEKQRAEQEKQRADKLAQRLRELGIDPDQIK